MSSKINLLSRKFQDVMAIDCFSFYTLLEDLPEVLFEEDFIQFNINTTGRTHTYFDINETLIQPVFDNSVEFMKGDIPEYFKIKN